MNITEWQKNWDALGKDDPLWVVLTDPAKKGGGWDPKEFFETGRAEIERASQELSGKGVSLQKTRALDFGCGVGRLSQALVRHFERVDAVDISPSMIEHAKTFNQFPDRCHYYVNHSADLSRFEDNSFDFIFSAIALQHIEPCFSKIYLQEFIRVLKPGGIAFFQLLSATFCRNLFPAFFVNLVRHYKFQGGPFIGMFGLPRGKIESILKSSGATVIDRETHKTGWRWISHRYIVRKT